MRTFDEIETIIEQLRDNGGSAETAAREKMTEAADVIGELMMRREILPQRRAGENFEFEFEGTYFAATIGFYPDGRIGEVFINGRKLDTAQDIYARDLGIALSIAIQYGATLESLAKAMTRDAQGRAQGLGGHVLDLIRGAR